MLNGRPIGPFMHRISGFVHQDDLFMGGLTVLEHITFMVELNQYAFKICLFSVIIKNHLGTSKARSSYWKNSKATIN